MTDQPLEHQYQRFYEALTELREAFYRIGRYDDANAKLDELCKLFLLRHFERAEHIDRQLLTEDSLRHIAVHRFNGKQRLARALRYAHDQLRTRFGDTISQLGISGDLALREDDDEFAAALVPVIESLPDTSHNVDGWSFDLLNELFGHFVQQSFRHRKEDAQYLTPPEVVEAMTRIGLADLSRDISSDQETVVVADPTCGVGSFLAAARQVAHSLNAQLPPLQLVGQDKVDRMVRMANVNLRIFSGCQAEIRQGNSVTRSPLSQWNGLVDLILTNPPFGASFSLREVLRDAAGDYPILTEMSEPTLPMRINSEFLLVDRELALLKPGGRMLMVVPDKVVSGGGFSSQLRQAIRQQADLVAVIELPAETFAQAGTRTKTSVIYLQKKPARRTRKAVFMATCEHLGFQVSSRSGVTVKRLTGENRLPQIVDYYLSFNAFRRPDAPFRVISEQPSTAAVPAASVIDGWTASFFCSELHGALRQLGRLTADQFRSLPLSALVEIDPDRRRKVIAADDTQCISVLHVREDGFIDLEGVAHYQPTTPCVGCQSGDVLLSRINPRICRICVVPESAHQLACSAEFAVLRCTAESPLNSYMLALLLRSRVVQHQICAMTSGTSSSHNRIKPREVASLLLPVPSDGSPQQRRLHNAAAEYRSALQKYYRAVRTAIDVLRHADEII